MQCGLSVQAIALTVTVYTFSDSEAETVYILSEPSFRMEVYIIAFRKCIYVLTCVCTLESGIHFPLLCLLVPSTFSVASVGDSIISFRILSWNKSSSKARRTSMRSSHHLFAL